MRLDGFGIFVERMPTMVRFYRDVLGFEIREDENASNVYLEKDGTLFLLYRRADFEKMTGRRFGYAGPVNGHYRDRPVRRKPCGGRCGFPRGRRQRRPAVIEPTTEPWGQLTCYVADPEGNLIEIGSFKA